MDYSRGFGAVSILITIAILAVVVFVGWRVYESHQSAKKDKSSTTNVNNAVKKSTQSLVNGRVSFTLPGDWSVVSRSGTQTFVGGTAEMADGKNAATLTPSKDVLNSHNEPFTINISVYKQIRSEAPKEWFENDLGGSMPTGSDKESMAAVNGYDAYMLKQVNDSYQEYSYVIYHNNLFVYISWRPIETHFTPERVVDQHIDHTNYDGDILNMVNSININ